MSRKVEHAHLIIRRGILWGIFEYVRGTSVERAVREDAVMHFVVDKLRERRELLRIGLERRHRDEQ